MANAAGEIELAVDVTEAVGGGTESFTCASVFLPAVDLTGTETVVVGFAGGGYDRSYYDMGTVDGDSYSMATHFTNAGCVFVACDHVGTGGSSHPDAARLSMELMADVDALTVRGVLAELSTQMGVALWSPSRLVGVGHAMGGCLLTMQQARHATFDSVALLGWSGLHNVVPVPPPDAGVVDRPEDYTSVPGTPAGYNHYVPRPPALLWAFVTEDTDPGALALDRSCRYPTLVSSMVKKGIVAAEAATIELPVFLAFGGERDTALDPYREASAYRSSRDITLFIVPHAAHCHNFARTRMQLWDRILQWILATGNRP